MVESIRFSGLASGMDTQSIVDSMMRASRQPLDKLKQQKQVLEWQRDDYREMNKLLKEFDQFIFDGIYRQSNMMKRSTTTSNDQYVTATASAEAGNVTYKIEDVKLATAARRSSAAGISKDIDLNGTLDSNEKIDPTKSLWSQQAKFGTALNWTKDTDFTTNSFTVPEGGAKDFQLTKGAISDIKDTNTNSATSITVTSSDGTSTKNFTIRTIPITDDAPLGSNEVFIDSDTGKMTFGTNLAEGDTFKVDYKQNHLEFAIKTYDANGKAQYADFKIAGTNSLNQMFNQINTSSSGVNAFYDSGTDKVVMTRKETGNFNTTGDEIEFFNSITRNANGSVTEGTTAGNFFEGALKLTDKTDGSDNTFTINGLETSRKSNTFTMNGVTFTLKKDMAPGESASISTSTDTESIYKTIKDFVDKYNDTIGKVNGKLTEERYRTFTPLSDEQKTSMKDKEIEQWEEKAKSGLIKRDSMLTSGLGKMRMDMYAEVTSNSVTLTDKNYNQLSEIGIKTTKDYLERGKLEIDETKLKAAIEKNPEAVYQLFMADGPTHDQKGLARRLRDSIDDTMGKVEEKAGNSYKTEQGYSMGMDLLRIKSDIDTWDERLKQIEQRYWNQFNAMEKAMQQMNNQSNQLMSQLGSMQQQ